ncbi:MAG: hypothetical protein HQK87_08625, partial [Nitrospinae bacterium]|nr:hypothetical protein [Nitrospinota bacterium]
MRPTKALCSILTALLLPLATACATKVEGLRADPSFTAVSLRERSVAVGAVEGLTPLPLETTLGYAQELRIGFLDRRPWLTTVDAGSLRAALGEVPYETLRESWRVGAAAGRDQIDALHQALPDVGYAVFARIEENTLRSWRDRETLRESRTRGDGTTYTVETGVRITATVERRMSVSLSIIDLAAGGEVWGGRVTKSRQ